MAERYSVFSDPNNLRLHGIRDAKVGDMGAVIAMVPTQALDYARELVSFANQWDAVREERLVAWEKENLDGPSPVS